MWTFLVHSQFLGIREGVLHLWLVGISGFSTNKLNFCKCIFFCSLCKFWIVLLLHTYIFIRNGAHLDLSGMCLGFLYVCVCSFVLHECRVYIWVTYDRSRLNGFFQGLTFSYSTKSKAWVWAGWECLQSSFSFAFFFLHLVSVILHQAWQPAHGNFLLYVHWCFSRIW